MLNPNQEAYESCIAHFPVYPVRVTVCCIANKQHPLRINSNMYLHDCDVSTFTILQLRTMEINEKDLFTEEETELIEGLMMTTLNHGEKIINTKKQLIEESIRKDPFIVKLKEGVGDLVNIDEMVSRLLKEKEQDVLRHHRKQSELASSILVKLAARRHTKK